MQSDTKRSSRYCVCSTKVLPIPLWTKFIVVTDDKPLLSVFSPTKTTQALAASRLARWALILNQYNYSIEYRNTSAHGNADVLSRLPSGPDENFDHEEEKEDDMFVINSIKTISPQMKLTDP